MCVRRRPKSVMGFPVYNVAWTLMKSNWRSICMRWRRGDTSERIRRAQMPAGSSSLKHMRIRSRNLALVSCRAKHVLR